MTDIISQCLAIFAIPLAAWSAWLCVLTANVSRRHRCWYWIAFAQAFVTVRRTMSAFTMTDLGEAVTLTVISVALLLGLWQNYELQRWHVKTINGDHP